MNRYEKAVSDRRPIDRPEDITPARLRALASHVRMNGRDHSATVHEWTADILTVYERTADILQAILDIKIADLATREINAAVRKMSDQDQTIASSPCWQCGGTGYLPATVSACSGCIEKDKRINELQKKLLR